MDFAKLLLRAGLNNKIWRKFGVSLNFNYVLCMVSAKILIILLDR